MTVAAIADVIRTYAAGRPDAVALEVDGRSVTFGELDRRSSQAAQALRAAGVGHGDRVAFIDKNGAAEWFDVTFGLVLMTHPAIDDVAVIGVPDERWGEVV